LADPDIGANAASSASLTTMGLALGFCGRGLDSFCLFVGLFCFLSGAQTANAAHRWQLGPNHAPESTNRSMNSVQSVSTAMHCSKIGMHPTNIKRRPPFPGSIFLASSIPTKERKG
jgi:hypothetical protein